MDKIAIGKAIRAARKAKRLSCQMLAAKAGYSDTHIYQIERGEVSVSIEALETIAKALDCEIEFVLLNPMNPQSYPKSPKKHPPRVPSPALGSAVDLLKAFSQCHDDERAAILAYAKAFLSLPDSL